MLLPTSQSTMRLVLFTVFVCLVHSRPAERVKRRTCGDGMVDIAGDCIPLETVRDLRKLLCELSSYLSDSNPLSGLNKFCSHKQSRVWGNDGFRVENSREEERRIWGNDGFKRSENDEKRAWWHSGLKPDRR